MLINHRDRVAKHLENGEQLYNIVFYGEGSNEYETNPLSNGECAYAYFDDLGKFRIAASILVSLHKPRYKFTESEIKQLDERLMAFAIPVSENQGTNEWEHAQWPQYLN